MKEAGGRWRVGFDFTTGKKEEGRLIQNPDETIIYQDAVLPFNSILPSFMRQCLKTSKLSYCSLRRI